MKQKVSAPVAAVVSIAVAGALGFILYRHYMAGPPIESQPKGFSTGPTGPTKPAQIPHTKEEGMALYRNMNGGKK